MSPLKVSEYLISLMVMSVVRLAVGVIPMTILAIAFFGFNLFGFGFALVAFFCNLIFTSWSFGLISSGLVLRNGMGAEGLAWTLMFALLPLTCVYYPVSVLPEWLQVVAWMLPPTYVFEGMRALLIDRVFRADLMLEALAINLALFAVSTVAFLLLLKSARKHGSLVQSGE
jgi:ABC-2 type transport system permease protein